MRSENDFASAGERLVAALASYQKGIKSVDYELKANRKRGFIPSPVMDDLGMELIFLLGNDGLPAVARLVAELRTRRIAPESESHSESVH
jgi:hypothetical protein